MEKGRVQSVGTLMGTLSSPRAPKKGWRSQGGYLVGSVGQRSRGDRGSGCPGRCPHADRAHGAGRGSLRARRGLLQVTAEVSGHGWELLLTTLHSSPSQAWAGSHTFEAISTQALNLILASRKARGTILARLALTRGAVVALPDAPAAQEAVGEV